MILSYFWVKLFSFCVLVNQNEIESNLLKLSYDEVQPCPEAAAATWTKILEKCDEPVDKKILLEAVKAGKSKSYFD